MPRKTKQPPSAKRRAVRAKAKVDPASRLKQLEQQHEQEQESRVDTFAGPGLTAIVQHPKRHLIEKALIEGQLPVREVARMFFPTTNVTTAASRLNRYKARELDTRVKREAVRQDADVFGEFRAATRDLYNRTLQLADAAESEQEFGDAVMALKVAGEHQDRWGKAIGAIVDPEQQGPQPNQNNIGHIDITQVFALPHIGPLVEGEPESKPIDVSPS